MLPHRSPTAPKRKLAMPSASRGGAPKKCGSYSCGHCGLPKKGHVCPSAASPVDVPPSPRPDAQPLCCALSFYEDRVAALEGPEAAPEAVVPLVMLLPPMAVAVDVARGILPGRLLAEVPQRLPPKELMVAAAVCSGWKECVGRVWRVTEELRLWVP